MKTSKLFIVLLALVLTMSMTAVSFADTTVTTLDNTQNIDVTGSYNSGGDAGDIYSVDIAWEAMEFTYTAASSTAWNPKTHTYDTTASAGWIANGNTVKTTNHSNKPVNVALSFTNDTSTAPNVTGSFDNANYTLATAVGTTFDNAPSETSTLTLGGTLDAVSGNVKIGTVTVALTK